MAVRAFTYEKISSFEKFNPKSNKRGIVRRNDQNKKIREKSTYAKNTLAKKLKIPAFLC